MPGRRSSPPHRGHRLAGLPSAPACRVWGSRSGPAWEPIRPSSPLLCRDMALQNALYTGDLARLQELFPLHSTADLLLERRAAEPRWSCHQRGEGLPGVEGGLRTRVGVGARADPIRPRDTKCMRKRRSPWLLLPFPEACLSLGPGVKSCGAQNSFC